MSRGPRYVFEVGQKFDRLIVLKDKLNGVAHCKCECGKKRDFRKIDLLRGATRSCGCWSVDRSWKHGLDGTPTHFCWAGMLSRCRNEKNHAFKHYGGRGILVCDRWHDFRNFLADMGEKPDGMSIDRINNNGNYEPSNCRWATSSQQNRNKRASIKIMYGGVMTSVRDIAQEHGVPPKRLVARILRGIPLKDAVRKGKFSRWKEI